jgi:uncharacterized alkaline shock family protein YloU
MADNKQYINQAQENGNVMISEDVIITIVSLAVREVEGVIGICTKPGNDIVELLGKKNWGAGIKLHIDADSQIHIDCNIQVAYGQNVVEVAYAAQEAVAAAIESMTGVKVADVNINVCGIERK